MKFNRKPLIKEKQEDKMEISKTTIIIVAVLVIAAFFFVLAIAGNSGTTGQAVSNAGQFVGSGCGR